MLADVSIATGYTTIALMLLVGLHAIGAMQGRVLFSCRDVLYQHLLLRAAS